MSAENTVAAEVCAITGQFPKPGHNQLRYLITGGPTIEDLDAVRFISNRSTGRTGVLLAEAAAERGHQVTLILGPSSEVEPENVEIIRVRSAREMLAATQAGFEWCDVLLMSAAVSDYRPAERMTGKMHKGDEDLTIRLVRNPDILTTLAPLRTDQVVAGFSLDTMVDIDEALAKRERKGMDIIVANSSIAFGGRSTDATILERNRPAKVISGPTEEMAQYLVMRTEALAMCIRQNRSDSMRLFARRDILPE